jgi:hypothetical protein
MTPSNSCANKKPAPGIPDDGTRTPSTSRSPGSVEA